MHIALLRGINVGGRHKLPMKTLVEIFDEAGCTDVKTYIQSGNVVYGAEPELAARIPAVVKASIRERCGFEVPVVTRTAEDLRGVVAGNPFLREGVDEKTLHVAFLADLPAEDAVAALDPRRSPPD